MRFLTSLAFLQFVFTFAAPAYTLGGGVIHADAQDSSLLVLRFVFDEKFLQPLYQLVHFVAPSFDGETWLMTVRPDIVSVDYTVGVGSFALTNAGNISTAAGGGGSSQLTVTPAGGFLGQVNFTCAVSGAPTGVTCTVPPAYVTSTAAASTTLIVGTTSSTPPGSYSILVTASDYATGKITATSTVSLTVAAAPPALSLSSSGNINIAPGATTGNTATITVTPVNGFTGGVNLSCSLTSSPAGASDLPACSIKSPVSITGPAAATTTLTVITTAPTSASLKPPLGEFFLAGGSSILALVSFFGVPVRRRRWRTLLDMGMMVVIASAMVACSEGGGSGGTGGGVYANPGTTPGVYTFTVKAADAATVSME